MNAQVPPEVQQLADQLGITVDELMAKTQQPTQPFNAVTQEVQPVEATPPQEVTAQPPVSQEPVAPTETREQALERQLAESQQDLQQVRRMAQVAGEGRVVGSGGEGVPVGTAPAPPDIATIEPGLRFAYQNGLITKEQLTEKVGPLLASLLERHAGGEVT